MHQLDEMKLLSVVEELESRVRALETLTGELRMDISSLRQHRQPIGNPIAGSIRLPAGIDLQVWPVNEPRWEDSAWAFGMIGQG